jgi:hypothetical protein
MPKRHPIECNAAILSFPVYATKKAPTPIPRPSSTATVKLASDCLGVSLELMSFCYWTLTLLRNQRIDK